MDIPTTDPVTRLVPLEAARFDASFVRELPGDPDGRNIPRPVRGACYTEVAPTPVSAPRLLGWARPVARLLGLADPASPTGPEAEVLGGNRVIAGMRPYAARYGGHQFGVWAGQLGDGRAITLGELIAPDGRRYDLQLKGAGRTPYSRTADGRAVLRSSVREFLCSESMHALGVPTTRALSLVATGESVVRDMFYDGHPRPEPGAVVCRVAPSFIRFGHFEIHAAHGEHGLLAGLADYVIRHHYPGLGAPGPETYAAWFAEVCRRTALLAVHWMRVGFVHGVLNTDNMSILGLTVDYGPYGWLEGFDPDWTPNTTDAQERRYRYGQQPAIAHWNLVQLANALYPLIGETAPLERALAVYVETYERESARMWAEKMGLAALEREGDDALLAELMAVLRQSETDMTLFFRALARVPVQADAGDEALIEALRPAFYDERDATAPENRARLLAWLRRYGARIRAEGEPDAVRRERMNRVNPKYVLRNYQAQLAIDALEAGDASVLERLLRVLSRPYDEQPAEEDLAQRRPEWARHRPGCSALSCSS